MAENGAVMAEKVAMNKRLDLDGLAAAGGDVSALRALAQTDSKELSKALGNLGYKVGDRSVLREALLRPTTGQPTKAGRGTDDEVTEWLARPLEIKERANVLFRSGDIAGAAAVYEEAIQAMPSGALAPAYGSKHASRSLGSWDGSSASSKEKTALLATLHSNLAAARIKLEEWQAAKETASLALSFAPNNAKALLRRAMARRHLAEPHKDVQDDLLKALAADACLRLDVQRELRSSGQQPSKELQEQLKGAKAFRDVTRTGEKNGNGAAVTEALKHWVDHA